MKMNPYNMPQIIKETSDGYFHLSVLDDLLSQREIYCLGEIDADSAGSLILQLQYLAAQEGIDTLDSQYTDKVVFIFLVPGEQEESFKAKLVESTNGRAVIRTDGEVYYGKCGGELILL